MGADMIMGALFFNDFSLTDKERKARLVLAIKEDDMDSYYWADFAERFGYDEEADKEMVREHALEIVENVFKSIIDSREIISMDHMDCRIYLAGGMSWGESPGEACDLLYNFSTIPERIKSVAEIDNNRSVLDLFMKCYKSKLPKKFIKQLEALKVAEAL